MLYYANDKYNAVLSQGYKVGDTTLYVNTVPTNVPTIVVVKKGTADETVFSVTGKTSNSLTGVARLKGANVNIDTNSAVTCLNNEEFVNQYATAIFNTEGLKDMLYAADGGSTDAYAISLTPVPSSLNAIIGIPITFKANTANTGAATLNINSFGAKTIKKLHDQDLDNNDIEANQLVTVVYDGAVFQMQSQIANEPAVTTPTTMADDALWNAAGDIPYASADNVGAVLPIGSTGAILRVVAGLPAWVAPRIKIGTFTRAQDGSDASVGITGVGFTPKIVILFGGVSGVESRFIGVDDGTNHYVDVVATTAAHLIDTSYSMKTLDNGSWDEKGNISSMDSDGFTISWVKGGSPPSATIRVFYVALG